MSGVKIRSYYEFGDVKMKMNLNFTNEQKVILVNQMQVLKKLSEISGEMEEVNLYERAKDGIKNGFGVEALQYLPEFDFKDDVTDKVKKFVWDVINMYDSIYALYGRLGMMDQYDMGTEKIEFIGFNEKDIDGSLSYFKFVTEDPKFDSRLLTFIKKNKWSISSDGSKDKILKAMVDNFNNLVGTSDYNNLSDEEKIKSIVEFNK